MSELVATPAEAAELKARHAAVFHKPWHQRLLAPVAVLATLAYVVFCGLFFDLPRVFAEAKWDRASVYIADWYSWEAQPRFRFKDNAVELEWTRSLLGRTRAPTGS